MELIRFAKRKRKKLNKIKMKPNLGLSSGFEEIGRGLFYKNGVARLEEC